MAVTGSGSRRDQRSASAEGGDSEREQERRRTEQLEQGLCDGRADATEPVRDALGQRARVKAVARILRIVGQERAHRQEGEQQQEQAEDLADSVVGLQAFGYQAHALHSSRITGMTSGRVLGRCHTGGA